MFWEHSYWEQQSVYCIALTLNGLGSRWITVQVSYLFVQGRFPGKSLEHPSRILEDQPLTDQMLAKEVYNVVNCKWRADRRDRLLLTWKQSATNPYRATEPSFANQDHVGLRILQKRGAAGNLRAGNHANTSSTNPLENVTGLSMNATIECMHFKAQHLTKKLAVVRWKFYSTFMVHDCRYRNLISGNSDG